MGRTALDDMDMTGMLFQLAQIAKGPSWLLPRTNSSSPYQNETTSISNAMNISQFSNPNLVMNTLGDHTVSFRYKFRDFKGVKTIFTGWEATVYTRCQDFVTSQLLDMVIPFTSSNFTKYHLYNRYRWILPVFDDQTADHSGPDGIFKRNTTIQICMSGTNHTVCLMVLIAEELWLVCVALGLVGTSRTYNPPPVLASDHPYLTNSSIVFNCTLDINSSMITHRSLDDFLKLGLVLPTADIVDTDSNRTTVELFRDFSSTLEFDFGVGRENRSASELWLSAYIGNYIGNCLSYLNEFLRRVKIEDDMKGINTKLEVKWGRVVGILGGLAGFQVLCGLAALLYCHRGFEIVDDVSTFSYMFADFPFRSEEERRQASAVRNGKFKFVIEGDRVRWAFVARAGKDIKVT